MAISSLHQLDDVGFDVSVSDVLVLLDADDEFVLGLGV